MTDLYGGTLTAFTLGLLGSGHCLAMCGGIMGALSMRSVSAGGPSIGSASLIGQLLLYSGGRLLSYALLGLLFGLIGAVLVSALEPAKLILRGVAGALLIAMGLYLAGLWQGILIIERLGHRLWTRLGPGLHSGSGGSLVLGMSWGLLPCGLVYGTLAFAASSADPLRSAWLMFAFGLGTLPAVLAGSYFSAALLAPLRRKGPRLAAGILVGAFGVWTLAGGGIGPHAEGGSHHHGNPPTAFHRHTGADVQPVRSSHYGRA